MNKRLHRFKMCKTWFLKIFSLSACVAFFSDFRQIFKHWRVGICRIRVGQGRKERWAEKDEEERVGNEEVGREG